MQKVSCRGRALNSPSCEALRCLSVGDLGEKVSAPNQRCLEAYLMVNLSSLGFSNLVTKSLTK
jgi:hypothetical protein